MTRPPEDPLHRLTLRLSHSGAPLMGGGMWICSLAYAQETDEWIWTAIWFFLGAGMILSRFAQPSARGASLLALNSLAVTVGIVSTQQIGCLVGLFLGIPINLILGLVVVPRRFRQAWVGGMAGGGFTLFWLREIWWPLEVVGSGPQVAVLSVVGSMLIAVLGITLAATLEALEHNLDGVVSARRELVDINTELAKARDRALAANRAKDQFLANMSHELRTPLNAVMGYTELALEDLVSADQPDAVRDLHRVDAAARHLLGLISGILELTRVDVDDRSLEISVVDVPGAITDAVAVLRHELTGGGHQLHLDGPSDGVAIATDLMRTRQILVNLLSNAVKFTDHGEIWVRWRRHRDGVEVEVQDSGPGIAPEALDRIFERFEQLDPSSTRTRGGAGLGLTITQRLVTLLQGELTVRSTVGSGTTFAVYLPDLDLAENAAVREAS